MRRMLLDDRREMLERFFITSPIALVPGLRSPAGAREAVLVLRDKVEADGMAVDSASFKGRPEASSSARGTRSSVEPRGKPLVVRVAGSAYKTGDPPRDGDRLGRLLAMQPGIAIGGVGMPSLVCTWLGRERRKGIASEATASMAEAEECSTGSRDGCCVLGVTMLGASNAELSWDQRLMCQASTCTRLATQQSRRMTEESYIG